jgi:hypothetical protein
MFTDVHLECIDSFRSGIGLSTSVSSLIPRQSPGKEIIDSDEEIFPQSEAQEILVYQFAGLTRRVYERLGRALGSDFDMSAAVQELRLNNWVSPIYARLQRRFVRFVASNVEEKLEELTDASYETMLSSVVVDIFPKYFLPSSSSSPAPPMQPADQYPAWMLAEYIIKVIRNAVSSIDIPSIEAKISNKFQTDLSRRMRLLGKSIERLVGRDCASLEQKDIKQIEDMLNIGHASTGAVYCLWHIRHNIVGVLDDKGTPVKDFIRPVMLHCRPELVSAPPSVFECIPKGMRNEVQDILDNAFGSLDKDGPIITREMSSDLTAAATLAQAARITAGNDLRSLITYNSDSEDWPSNRDDTFVVVLAKVLSDYIEFDQTGDARILYENLIALAVLEETIGVREPRDACIRAYVLALKSATVARLKIQPLSAHNLDKITSISSVYSRMNDVRLAMVAMMRVPAEEINRINLQAFKITIGTLIADVPTADISTTCLRLADMLGVNENIAKSYLTQLNDARYMEN